MQNLFYLLQFCGNQRGFLVEPRSATEMSEIILVISSTPGFNYWIGKLDFFIMYYKKLAFYQK